LLDAIASGWLLSWWLLSYIGWDGNRLLSHWHKGSRKYLFGEILQGQLLVGTRCCRNKQKNTRKGYDVGFCGDVSVLGSGGQMAVALHLDLGDVGYCADVSILGRGE